MGPGRPLQAWLKEVPRCFCAEGKEWGARGSLDEGKGGKGSEV